MCDCLLGIVQVEIKESKSSVEIFHGNDSVGDIVLVVMTRLGCVKIQRSSCWQAGCKTILCGIDNDTPLIMCSFLLFKWTLYHMEMQFDSEPTTSVFSFRSILYRRTIRNS